MGQIEVVLYILGRDKDWKSSLNEWTSSLFGGLVTAKHSFHQNSGMRSCSIVKNFVGTTVRCCERCNIGCWSSVIGSAVQGHLYLG